MKGLHLVFVLAVGGTVFSQLVEGPKPIVQKTVHSLFTYRDDVKYPGTCKWIPASPPQTKLCQHDRELPNIIQTAKTQALTYCKSAFQYDRWNCTSDFNMKTDKSESIFDLIYRETAFVYALEAASLTHAIAKSCATGGLIGCACPRSIMSTSIQNQWKISGCSDDIKFGKRFAKRFLQIKKSGNDLIGSILKQNVNVGTDAVAQQMKEVCKCHGFSGSCTMKTCWRRVSSFNSTVMLLRRQYHHAVKKKFENVTIKRAVRSRGRKHFRDDPNKQLLYLEKTPNLCKGTHGRICRDPNNCATLCCGRGYTVAKLNIDVRCKCRMVNCCFVKCDICRDTIDVYICK